MSQGQLPLALLSRFDMFGKPPICACRPNGLYDVTADPSTEEQAADGGGLFGSGSWGCLWPGAIAAACNNHKRAHKKRRGPAVQLEFVRGETVSEARQVFGDWAALVTRWAAWPGLSEQ